MAKYIVDSIFPACEIHLTGGASGSGKTTLEAQIVEDWRQGKDVFGYKSHPTPFCYVACDRSKQSIQATMSRVGVKWQDWPMISLVDNPVASTFSGILAAARILVSNVETIWIDGIHSLVPGGKINEYDAVQTFLVGGTRLCQRENVTFKGMGHATKVRENERFVNPRHRFLGSVAWGGYSDTMVFVDQADPEHPTDTTRLIHLLPRNEEGQLLKYHMVDGKLVPLDDAGPTCMDRWIQEQPLDRPISTANLETQGEKFKMSRPSLHRWKKKAITEGRIIEVTRGLFLPAKIQ